MARTAAIRKKKKQLTKEEILAQINRLLEDVSTAGPRFSPQEIQKFYETALAKREERLTEERTPETEEFRIGDLVFKRVDAPKRMTQEAFEELIKLAGMLESAKKGKDLNLKKWVTG